MVAVVVAALPSVVVLGVDAIRHEMCLVPSAKDGISEDHLMSGSDVVVKKKHAADVPSKAVKDSKAAAGRTTARKVAAGDCLAEDDLQARRFEVPLPSTAIARGAVTENGAVDVLLAPTDGRDSRSGAVVADAVVKTVAADGVITVTVTEKDRATLLEYLGRSVVTVVKDG